MSPKRIQMPRQHPWRAENPDAVIVDHRSKYGNPFRISSTEETRKAPRWWHVSGCQGVDSDIGSLLPARQVAVERFAEWLAQPYLESRCGTSP